MVTSGSSGNLSILYGDGSPTGVDPGRIGPWRSAAFGPCARAPGDVVCGVGVDTEPERVDALAREFVAEGAALDPGFCISIGKAGELELGLRIRLGLAHESIRDLEPTQRFARLESVRALGVAVDDTE